MKWKTSILALLLLALFSITASAQVGIGVAVAGGSALAAGVEIGFSSVLVAHEFLSPMQQMAARRAVYNAKQATAVVESTPAFKADDHASTIHGGVVANQAWVEAHTDSDRGGPCKDNRYRYAKKNTSTGRPAFSVEDANGKPITAFYAEDWDYVEKALARDGCADEMKKPTLNVGHDNMHPWPYSQAVVPGETGQPVPVKQRTPSALEIVQARRAEAK